jgi:hypothetical protein
MTRYMAEERGMTTMSTRTRGLLRRPGLPAACGWMLALASCGGGEDPTDGTGPGLGTLTTGPATSGTTCATVQADSGAQLDVRFGCDVGFEPAG